MLIARQSQDTRIPIRLLDSMGAPVTGKLPADVLAGKATLVKSDGTTVDIVLTNGVNWFEIDSVKAPGLYHIKVLAANLGTVGPTQLAVVPAAAAFVSLIDSFLTETIAASAENAPALTWDQLRASHTGSTTFGGLMRVLKQMLSGRVKIDPIAGTLVIYQEDNTTPLQSQVLKDTAGNPAGLNAVERQ